MKLLLFTGPNNRAQAAETPMTRTEWGTGSVRPHLRSVTTAISQTLILIEITLLPKLSASHTDVVNFCS